MINEIMNQIIQHIVVYSNLFLLPLMCVGFGLGAFFRWVIYFTVRCEYRFACEFEKRVHKQLAHEEGSFKITSFHMLTKKILENTYYEHFELKRKFHRRRFDQVTSITDRFFLIREGAARLIKDTLSQTQYLRKDGKHPKFVEISKFVFNSNPVFNRVLGALPMGLFHDLVNILPGLFVIGGIFGTFNGVMQALPQLGHMDISNVEATKKVMDTFLLNIAFSMGTSILGIAFSVAMTVLNSTMSPDSLFINAVNKFTSSLEFLWNETATNDLARDELRFPGEKPDRRAYGFAESQAPAAYQQQDPLEREVGTDTSKLDQEDLQREKVSLNINGKRIKELEQKLQMLDVYTKMAYEDRLSGVISEELWKQKSDQWVEERRTMEAELRELLKSSPRRAA